MTDKQIQLCTSPQGGPLVIYHAVRDEGEMLWKCMKEADCPPCSLAVIRNVDWNHEMSPWEIPPFARGAAACTGGADEYLKKLVNEIMPRICAGLAAPPDYCALAGYSLAGLFAVYAAYRTDCFERIASVSGSLWYPDFLSFAKENLIAKQIKAMYFSLGDREGHTKNPYFAPVEENTRQLEQCVKEQGIETVFQMNRGNHHQDMVPRMAAGMKWILEASAH